MLDPNKPLDRSRYGRPLGLSVEDIAPATAIVVTVTAVDEVERPGLPHPFLQRKGEMQLYLSVREFEDRAVYLNLTGARIITERLGDTPKGWIGQRVPLTVRDVFNPATQRDQQSLGVAPSGDWPALLAEDAKARKPGKAKAKAE